MPRPDAVHLAAAVFESCKTAESRTSEALTPVLEILQELAADGGELLLAQAARVCADASREEGWRTPLGESGIVGLFQDVFSRVPGDQELGRHCLRLIGNACADNDENRRRVVGHPDSLRSVIAATASPGLCPVATVVLYNICLDHEPSQLKAIADGACPSLLEAIGRDGFLEDGDIELDYFGRTLEALLSHDAGKSSCPPSSLDTLVSLASSAHCGFDDFLTLLTLLSALLSTSDFQHHLIALSLLPQTLDLLERFYSLSVDPESQRQDEKLITYARNALVENIGDVSSQDSFLATYPLSSPLVARVRSWLGETDEGKVDLVVAACLIFGNIGRSDEVCGALAKEYGVHKELFGIIRRTVRKYNHAVEEARKQMAAPVVEGEKKKGGAGKGAVAVGVLHAATGVLKNLAIAKGNREILGPDGALDVVREMFGMEGVGVGQVWYSAAGFGRLVCVNCPGNVEILLLLQQSPAAETPLLADFLRVYAAAEELPTKTEIARTIAGVLRTLNSSPTAAATYPELETALYKHPVARPLWDMILQDKWPVVRSEGLFALALMARGAAEEVWRGCGEAEEKVLRGLEKKDLDNGVILVAEVKKRLAGEVEDRVDELLAGLLQKREQGAKVDLEVRAPES